ncbi:MAG: adenylosuccinate synthase [Fimbriimonadaceae bacterium]
MSSVVVVGAQWGDEAKGKLVDYLASNADYVVRFSGGNNAGHTIVAEGRTYKLHLVPSGILQPKTVSIIASGVVVCPAGLLKEIETLQQSETKTGELRISAAAHVVFPYHRMLDRLEETVRGENRIGTTSRGIGPCYQDKVARIGIRMGELVDPDQLATRLRPLLKLKNQLLEQFGEPVLDFDDLLGEYAEYGRKFKPFVGETEQELASAHAAGKRILFEGAQGTYLDLDSGTYPFVTSSHPIAAGACLGTGIGPRAIDSVLAVCKAYTTRVGEGPFPTEMGADVAERLREAGSEYGTTTGRGRRCGWLDLPMLKTSASLNSVSGWVVTRLDVLSRFGALKVCSGYWLKDSVLDYAPTDSGSWGILEPIYEEHPGWAEDLTGCRNPEDLPASVVQYLQRIEDFTGVPVAIASVGPDRDQTIVMRPDLL